MNYYRYFNETRWSIGFSFQSLDDIIKGDPMQIQWMKHNYHDRWFADPFILEVAESEIAVLVEEYYYPIRRGRIAKLIIDRNTLELKHIDTVLQTATHLSFPAILRQGDEIKLYPENSASGQLDLYKYNPLDNSCTFAHTICRQPLTDAVFTDFWDQPFIFSTHTPIQNGDTLGIYGEQNGEYVHLRDVVFYDKIARNAGDFFSHGGEIYRPAQDCAHNYGGGVIIQKVEKQNGTFHFTDIRRIDIQYRNYTLGCHTFNHYKGISVIDVHGYRRPILAKATKTLSIAKRKLLK